MIYILLLSLIQPSNFQHSLSLFYIWSIILSNDVATWVLLPSYSSTSFALTDRCHHGPWAPLTPLLSHWLLLTHWYSFGVHYISHTPLKFFIRFHVSHLQGPQTQVYQAEENVSSSFMLLQ